ncbi:MAG: SsrA-binding protein SmpB, partial [Elusimicrobiota bacterium]|nr:SsrA-binding protein SmpB [Elusimicrobiota bacterium]
MNKAIINKKAYHDYFIIEEFEAGIQLFGAEVKSIRNGRINFKDSFVKIKKNEAYLINTHISVYEKVSSFDSYNPTRNRKLLLHKKEINKIRGKVEEKGMSMVPLSAYFNKQNFFKIK